MKLTPVKRPEDDVELQRSLTPQDAWKNWIEESLPEKLDGAPLRLRRFRPGVLLPKNMTRHLEMPDNISITISKQGKAKAEITVRRDDEEYSATEDSLADLWAQNPTLKELREGMPDKLGGICARCLMKHRCLGSCVAQNYYRTKSFWSPYWLCEEAEREGLFPESRRVPAPA